MQKLVKGATKPKSTAPKAKYIEPILASTYEGGHDFEVVMESLGRVIAGRNQAWPSVYKGLIVVHIMMREGAEDVTLKYAARHTRLFDIEDYAHRAPAMERYARYLSTKAHEFRETKVDYVRYKTRQGFSRLHKLSVDEGLLRECRSVIVQLDVLTKCQYQEQDIVSDDVLLMAFRLLVHDALSLFQVLNEGVINLLEHFFELSHTDAEQALDIYRAFRNITSRVIQYLRIAKDFEFKTMLHVPNIKHAPTSLVSSLEMYLNDPDFEKNRKQYLSEKQDHVKRTRSRRSGSGSRSGSASGSPRVPSRSASTSHRSASSSSQAKSQLPPTAPQPAPAAAAAAPLLASQPPSSVQIAAAAQGAPPVAVAQPAPAHVPSDGATNPFWQAQSGASHIQATDVQAQQQMQQLHQLQMQQQEQQERIRVQIQQLQLQAQQAQQTQPAHIDFDFGVQQAGIQPVQGLPTGAPPPQAVPQAGPQGMPQNIPQSLQPGLQQPSIQPVQPSIQPVPPSIQAVQPSIQAVPGVGSPPMASISQVLVPTQASEFNPFRASVQATNPFHSQPVAAQATGPLAMQYTGLTAHNTGLTAHNTGLTAHNTGMTTMTQATQPALLNQYTGPVPAQYTGKFEQFPMSAQYASPPLASNLVDLGGQGTNPFRM